MSFPINVNLKITIVNSANWSAESTNCYMLKTGKAREPIFLSHLANICIWNSTLEMSSK